MTLEDFLAWARQRPTQLTVERGYEPHDYLTLILDVKIKDPVAGSRASLVRRSAVMQKDATPAQLAKALGNLTEGIDAQLAPDTHKEANDNDGNLYTDRPG